MGMLDGARACCLCTAPQLLPHASKLPYDTANASPLEWDMWTLLRWRMIKSSHYLHRAPPSMQHNPRGRHRLRAPSRLEAKGAAMPRPPRARALRLHARQLAHLRHRGGSIVVGGGGRANADNNFVETIATFVTIAGCRKLFESNRRVLRHLINMSASPLKLRDSGVSRCLCTPLRLLRMSRPRPSRTGRRRRRRRRWPPPRRRRMRMRRSSRP